jgi:hypothetical protein
MHFVSPNMDMMSLYELAQKGAKIRDATKARPL